MVEFDQYGLFFNIVFPAVHTLLLPLALQCLDSRGIEALILILEKNPQLQIYDLAHYRSNTASQLSGVFMLGNRKLSDGARSGEYGR